MIILFIVIFIYLVIKNDKLTQENIKLKKELKESSEGKVKFCPNCGYHIPQQTSTIKKVPVTTPPQKKIETTTVIKEPNYNDREIKNSMILITGAILIIISAILFLTTTWNTSINLIKTIVIVLMFFVFLGSSFIADKYLQIKQTSKVFLYIAFSYLPLVFLSISIFQLLGHYLSFYGPGKYVFLALSSTIISMIYLYNMNQKKDIFFAIGSLIFQIISIILFILIYTESINIILIGINCYIILLNILYVKNKYYYNQEIHLKINKVLTIAIMLIPIYSIFFLNGLLIIDIPYVILMISLYINMYFLLVLEMKEIEIFKWISPILIIFISLSLAIALDKSTIIYQLLLLLGISIVYGKEMLKEKTISIESYIISSFTIISLYLYSISKTNAIPSYLLMLLYTLMSTYQRKNTNNNDIFNYIIPISLNISIIDMIATQNLGMILLPVIFLIEFIVNNLLKENKLTNSFSNISIVFTLLSFIVVIFDNYQEDIILSIIALLITLSTFIVYKKNDKKDYKYISYSCLIITLYYCFNTLKLDTETLLYILPISSIITFLVEKYLSKEEHQQYEYLFVEFLFSFIFLVFSKSILAILIYIMVVIIFVIHNKKWQKKEYLNIIPLLSFYGYIMNNSLTYHELNYNSFIFYTLSILLLAYLCYSKKKEYIIISLISIVLAIISFEINQYLMIIILLIYSGIYLYMDKERKPLYLFIIYTLATYFFKLMIIDLKLETITVLNIGIYILPLLLITRTILKEKNSDYKIIEYLGLVIIYLTAITKYTNELDGMIFVSLLVILSLLSYYKKIGPVFLTSLIFIILNTFMLTRYFWLSLPWWIYILLIGSTLITFAVRNELKEKSNTSKENKLQEIAKRIDL